ncbi:hypothetical protein KAR10_03125 [bacterium]|nr:hypothetical protein [bacterium]
MIKFIYYIFCKFPVLLFLTMFCLVFRAEAMEVEFGGGMEYFTVKIQAEDYPGRSFTTLIQSTLAGAQCRLQEGPWVLKFSGSLSDWNVSGEWQGTGILPFSTEPFQWAWQQRYNVEAGFYFLESMGVGVRLSDHALRHYAGDYDITYLEYRNHAYDLIIKYIPLRSQDLTLELCMAYSPAAYIEVYQNTYVAPEIFAIHTYNSSGRGQRWEGGIQMEYRDSAGWALALLYSFGWAGFSGLPELSEFSMKYGTLTGYFSLRF